MADWHYIGHYGQLGPLTREQVEELVEGGVIVRDTYVWRTGMADWVPAERVPELQDALRRAEPYTAPPPPPMPGARVAAPPVAPTPAFPSGYGSMPVAAPMDHSMFSAVRSDRSRAMGGLLQILFPGVGRMYLGYAAYGVLQLVLAVATCGILYLWSFVDGIIILTGGVKLDGFGRQLAD